MNNDARYSRQTLVAEIGPDGQSALQSASILIVGAGGLGCTIGAHLAGAGVGDITIVDHDNIELSNLHRQVLFREADIGKAKAEVAAREMRKINSNINVAATLGRVSPSSVAELAKDKTLIIDAADNFAAAYLLSDFCIAQNIPLLSASVNRTFGYVGGFCSSAPSLRALFPKLPKEQTSCDTVGVTGPSVGIIASVQSQEAIKFILGKPSLHGKLLYLDLWNYSQHSIDFSSAQEPNATPLGLISAREIIANDTVVDVRLANEIANSPQGFKVDLAIPLAEILAGSEHEFEARVVLCCASGQRALIAAQALLDAGRGPVAAIIPD